MISGQLKAKCEKPVGLFATKERPLIPSNPRAERAEAFIMRHGRWIPNPILISAPWRESLFGKDGAATQETETAELVHCHISYPQTSLTCPSLQKRPEDGAEASVRQSRVLLLGSAPSPSQPEAAVRVQSQRSPAGEPSECVWG